MINLMHISKKTQTTSHKVYNLNGRGAVLNINKYTMQ